MALSNKFGWMVLTTGNKSEMAVGYFTLYGDSVGGYGVIKDVLKTRVYDLCRYVNERGRARDHQRERHHQAAVGRAAPRPARRPEPAALRGARPDPRAVRRGDRTASEIVELGHDEALVRRITRLVDLDEYKRRQCPPGVRVSAKAFGKDRRLPSPTATAAETRCGADQGSDRWSSDRGSPRSVPQTRQRRRPADAVAWCRAESPAPTSRRGRPCRRRSTNRGPAPVNPAPGRCQARSR